MSTATLKTYFSYHEMMLDFSQLSDKMDFDKTIKQAPPYAFYNKDGQIVIGVSFNHFLQRVRDDLGIKVNPSASEDHRSHYLVSYEDYSPAGEVPQEKIEVKKVDSAAKKRSQRGTTKS